MAYSWRAFSVVIAMLSLLLLPPIPPPPILQMPMLPMLMLLMLLLLLISRGHLTSRYRTLVYASLISYFKGSRARAFAI